MNVLKEETYPKFVLEHVLRPYQSIIMDEERITSIMPYYRVIPLLGRDHHEWEGLVFKRIAKIFTQIDEGIFPNHDPVAKYIMIKCHDYGVKLIRENHLFEASGGNPNNSLECESSSGSR